MGLGLLYYSYSNKWITVYTSDKMKKALDSMKPGTEVFHEHYGVYGKVISEEPFIICGNCVFGLISEECWKVEYTVVHVCNMTICRY